MDLVPHRGPNSRSAFSVLSSCPESARKRRKAAGSVKFRASSSTPHRSALCCGVKVAIYATKAPQRRTRASGCATRPGGHGSPTSCRPCARCPTNPSRPGRLIAVTASQDRDETPRTHLGLPHAMAAVAAPTAQPRPAPAVPRSPAPIRCVRLGQSQPPKVREPESLPPQGQVFGSSSPVMRKTTVGFFFSTTSAFGPSVHFACSGKAGLPASIRSRVATT